MRKATGSAEMWQSTGPTGPDSTVAAPWVTRRLNRSYVARRYAIGPLSRGFEPIRRVAFCLHESGLRNFLGVFGGSGSLIPSQNRVR
jgi:hypothetical protein